MPLLSIATVTVSEIVLIVNNIKQAFKTQTSVVGINQIYVIILNSIGTLKILAFGNRTLLLCSYVSIFTSKIFSIFK